MTIEQISPEEIENKEKELLELIKENESIGNKTLRTDLVENHGWTEDLYWQIRNRLIEQGLLETGRGKGGSVRKIIPITEETDEIPYENKEQPCSQENILQAQIKESDFYSPIAEVLRTKWAKAQGFDSYVVEVTAKQGSRQTGGKWTRPDMTVVGYKTFPYLPGRFFEVISFEVKPVPNTDISAVYEALAHRRASTKAYVIIANGFNIDTENISNQLELLIEEAKKYGIGLILADSPDDFDTWETIVDGERCNPSPSQMNEFIAQQLSNGLKEQIVRWFK